MTFNDEIRLKVKQMAAFRCCRCHEIGIEVHHIIPEAQGGLDEIDNGAPLCPNCHTGFGANPEKRKEIRQMRDFWYDVVLEKYGPSPQLEALNDSLIHLQQSQEATTSETREIRRLLEELRKTNEIKPEDSTKTIQTKTTQYITATTLADRVHANFRCKKCGASAGLLIGTNQCPSCGELI